MADYIQCYDGSLTQVEWDDDDEAVVVEENAEPIQRRAQAPVNEAVVARLKAYHAAYVADRHRRGIPDSGIPISQLNKRAQAEPKPKTFPLPERNLVTNVTTPTRKVQDVELPKPPVAPWLAEIKAKAEAEVRRKPIEWPPDPEPVPARSPGRGRKGKPRKPPRVYGTCPVCGEDVKKRNAVCCSVECAGIKRRTLPDKKCERCGVTFHPGEAKVRFCSQACVWASMTVIPDRECPWCHESFHPLSRGQVHCGSDCLSADRKDQMSVCPVCGKPKKGQRGTCSRECAKVNTGRVCVNCGDPLRPSWAEEPIDLCASRNKPECHNMYYREQRRRKARAAGIPELGPRKPQYAAMKEESQ